MTETIIFQKLSLAAGNTICTEWNVADMQIGCIPNSNSIGKLDHSTVCHKRKTLN